MDNITTTRKKNLQGVLAPFIVMLCTRTCLYICVVYMHINKTFELVLGAQHAIVVEKSTHTNTHAHTTVHERGT